MPKAINIRAIWVKWPSWLLVASAVMTCIPDGPRRTPAAINPVTEGSRSACPALAAIKPTVSITASSKVISMSSPYIPLKARVSQINILQKVILSL